MLHSYAIFCRFYFEHDNKITCCTAQLAYCDQQMFAIRIGTDSNGKKSEPVTYAITNYRGEFWIANLNQQTTIFINDPLKSRSNAGPLRQLDDMEDEEAENLSEIIRYFYTCWDKEKSKNFKEEDELFPYLEDDYIPF